MQNKKDFYLELHYLEKVYAKIEMLKRIITIKKQDSNIKYQINEWDYKEIFDYYFQYFCKINNLTKYWQKVIEELLIYERSYYFYPIQNGNYDIITMKNLYNKIKQYSEEAKYNAE